MALPERRTDDIEVKTQLIEVNSKVDRLGDRLESSHRETRTAIEMLIQQQTERWEWFEKQADMNARSNKQSIDLLTGSVVKLQQDQSSTDTQLDMTIKEHEVLSARLIEQKKNADFIHSDHDQRINAINSNLRWLVRAMVTTGLSSAAAGILYLATH